MPTVQQAIDTQYKVMPGQINIDEAQGIVECFVAGIGNKDSVGDICVPGCFTESLKRRKPRVVWGHNWNEPIGKVLEIYEVSPNDPRLPMKMKRAGIGGLYARVQFNLKSDRGQQAFADVSFFGEEQEWSIGYKTLNADYDQGMQANILKEVELYEVSPVLHGANQLTATISIKSDEKNAGIYDVEDTDNYAGPRGEDGGVPAMNPSSGIAGNLARAIATRFGGAVRLRTADKNIAIFDHMHEGEKMTMRVTYHFDGDEFMFGNPIRVKPEIMYIPENDNAPAVMPQPNGKKPQSNPFASQYRDELNQPGVPDEIKPKACGCGCMGEKSTDEKAAPGADALNQIANIVGVDAPQERVTGDVARGYGPRRGNLEQLLRYWRPIMRKEGGFRRCRVILADHPELYPLNNICAWLHHETTGLWPNEGCHHPGMKNCRNKIKKGINGSLWNDRQWNDRMDSRFGKGLESPEEYAEFEKSAVYELKTFIDQEPEMMKFLSDDSNWEHSGEDETGAIVVHIGREAGESSGSGCGCGGDETDKPKPAMRMINALLSLQKSIETDMDTKAGRMISNRNMGKLKEAMQIIAAVIEAAQAPEMQMKASGEIRIKATGDHLYSINEAISPIVDYYKLDSEVRESGIYFSTSLSEDAKSAIGNVINGYKSADKAHESY
jgi:HK97 family phage prohead protease